MSDPRPHTPPTPMAAVLALTLLASMGTGVIWNGIFFIAEREYGWSQRRNLVLSLALGASYLIGAATAARLLRRAERWLSPRGAMLVILLVQALVCFGPLVTRSEWILWVVTIAATVLASFLWPIIESYLTAGRHGPAMRSGIGYWNMVWMASVAAAFFLMAPLLEAHARMAIVGLGAFNVVAPITLIWFRPRPGTHDHERHATAVQPGYPRLLRAARILLPLSYVLSAAMAPLLPYRLAELGVEVSWKTPATATWLTVRVVAALAMWRLAFWHGRWATLLLGGSALLGGFALVVAGGTLALVLVGFGIFGAGMGVIYYAALYYAMAVGRAEVEAGGTHEALIGVGYAVGPLAALAGLEAARLSGGTVAESTAIVAVLGVLVLLGAVPALRLALNR